MNNNRKYYSHRVVKRYLGIKKRIANRSLGVPEGFVMGEAPLLLQKHLKYLMALGYNIQFEIR